MTKNKAKVLSGEVSGRMRELIIDICESSGIRIVEGSIGPDHVSVLVACPVNLAPDEVVEYLKGRSSQMIQAEFPDIRREYMGRRIWSGGYFCSTVGYVPPEMIESYIASAAEVE
jgi:putative transposase